MLLKYRNQLFKVLKDNLTFDMRYIDYVYDETPKNFDYLKISVKGSGLFFLVKNPKEDYHTFYLELNTYHSPKLTNHELSGYSFKTTCDILMNWIISDLKKWYEENILDASQVDLWSTYFKSQQDSNFNQIDFKEQGYFNQDEKQQIVTTLEAIRLKIKEADFLQLNEDSLKLIDQRIEYLKSIIEKLNKFEWKSVLVTTIITIIISLSLDTARGAALIEIFKQGFQFIPKLLGLP